MTDIVESTPTEAYERGKDEAADLIFHALGKALRFEDWVVQDGSETWDGDVRGTMYGILRGAGVLDPETDELATAALIASQAARIRELEEVVEWYGEQARLARLIHSGGDPGRHALADDGGKRARSLLSRKGGE